ncbi:MAG: hypothetical protein ACR2RE_31010 [Geminicoccaceae bacterium]
MATNLAFPSSQLGRHGHTEPKAGFVLTTLALLLALILGLSAVDIQRQQVLNAGSVQAAAQGTNPLDGRGKWGGYL